MRKRRLILTGAAAALVVLPTGSAVAGPPDRAEDPLCVRC